MVWSVFGGIEVQKNGAKNMCHEITQKEQQVLSEQNR